MASDSESKAAHDYSLSRQKGTSQKYSKSKDSKVLFMPCCVVPPTQIGAVEVPHEDQGLRTRGQGSCLPIEGLIHAVFLVRQPVAEPHYDVTCPCPPFNPGQQLSAMGASPGEAPHTPAHQ